MAVRRVARLRTLTPRQARRLAGLRQAARLLDSAFRVPGTGYRVGLDPLLGLIPWLGDAVSPLFALAILWQARDLAVPRVVQLRMVINVAVDALIGLVPLAGDLFDFAWKANERNLALLERHAQEERPAAAGDWLFVVLTMTMLLALAAAPIVLLSWLLTWLARLVS